MKKNYTLLFGLLLAFALDIVISPAHAQSPTPTATTTATPTTTVHASVIATPTDSTTPTSTPEITETVTPTPTEIPAPQSKIETSVLVKTQYPWNKKIPIVVTITPKVSGSQLQITWQKRLGITASPSVYTIHNPQANRSYSKTFLLSPSAPGSQLTVANVVLTTFNNNYVTSIDVPLRFSNGLEVYPKTSQYLVYTVVMWIVIIAVLFILLPYGVYKGFIYFRENIFPKWLESKVKVPQ